MAIITWQKIVSCRIEAMPKKRHKIDTIRDLGKSLDKTQEHTELNTCIQHSTGRSSKAPSV